jgi:hypothetical protein
VPPNSQHRHHDWQIKHGSIRPQPVLLLTMCCHGRVLQPLNATVDGFCNFYQSTLMHHIKHRQPCTTSIGHGIVVKLSQRHTTHSLTDWPELSGTRCWTQRRNGSWYWYRHHHTVMVFCYRMHKWMTLEESLLLDGRRDHSNNCSRAREGTMRTT